LKGLWLPYNINYEDYLSSLVSLFIISSPTEWPTFMLQLINSPSAEGGAPILNNNKWASSLYILFIIIGNFFSVNLFISMISIKFWEK
jgi:hypothetical protein